jgi:phytoene dehydrogenase-like protein
MNNKYDIIVVGGGIAGLTATAYLSKDQKKTLLIEKNSKCGGLVNTFQHNGFYFDAGVRALESAGIIYPMLKDLNIELEIVKSPVSVGIENDILNIVDIDSLYDYQDLLIKYYPESSDDIHKIIKIIRKIMKNMDVLYGIENPVFKDIKKDRTFLFKKLLPWLPKFLLTVGKINRLNMPVEAYLDEIIKDQSLKDIISQHFFKNTPTFFALSYFSLYLDYFYPKGGVGKLADALVDKIHEYGGEIKTTTSIKKVIPSKNLIKDVSGTGYEYNNMVWCADLKQLYSIIEEEDIQPYIINEYQEKKKNLLNKRGGDSVFSLFLEIDEPLETFRKISNGHFFYTPSKIGLGKTHWEELDNLINNWDKIEKNYIFDWLDKFTRLNTYEISIPGLKDSALVPKGKTGIIVSFLAEYDLFKKSHDSGWYKELIKEIEDRIIKVLTDSIYPIIKGKVLYRFSFTPISIKNRVGSSEGAITGWSFRSEVPVVNKIQFSDRSVNTPFPSIYQAGQWAYSPAGVPMSILTGKLAADRIIKKNRLNVK